MDNNNSNNFYVSCYKCRLCGEIYYQFGKVPEQVAIAYMKMHRSKDADVVACARNDLIDYHRCKDGNLGICDFQGFSRLDTSIELKNINL